MASDKFRHQLRQEAQTWRDEGLIDNSLYEQLSARYQFNNLEAAARNRFVMIWLGLGSILIGLGIITFVAANWQEIPRYGKVALLTSLFVGVNAGGFYLWRGAAGAKQRLGQGLLLLGALILGANMGLMGQLFHITGPFYELLLAWGLAVLAMAYSLRLTSLGVMSIGILGFGYWTWRLEAYAPFTGVHQFSWALLLGQHMPLIAALLFIGLAYWCRSRIIFGLGAIAFLTALQANLQLFRNYPLHNGWILSIAFVTPPALLWAYDDSWWASTNFRRNGSFPSIARNLALLCLACLFFLASFNWFWDGLSPNLQVLSTEATKLNWYPLIDLFVFTAIAILEWLRLILMGINQRRHSWDLTTVVIGIFICIAAVVPYWHISIGEINIFATLIFNILLFLLSVGLIREGLTIGQRRAFWSGLSLLTLRILGWFLFSNTELMFKALMFIGCGVGVMLIGLWFERYVRSLSDVASRRRERGQVS